MNPFLSAPIGYYLSPDTNSLAKERVNDSPLKTDKSMEKVNASKISVRIGMKKRH